MDPTTDSDASILWQDVQTLLAERSIPAANLAMIKSCNAVSFDGDVLTISTNMGFAQKKIKQQAPLIEECLEQAAFQPVRLEVVLAHDKAPSAIDTNTEMTREEIRRINQAERERAHARAAEARPAPEARSSRPEEKSSFENEEVSTADSKLTFDRFVAGDENMLAYEAAKQVANGENKSYNPLFPRPAPSSRATTRTWTS